MAEREAIAKIASRTVREGDCLRWQGAHVQEGYGSIRWDGKTRILHRVVYELHNGPIPQGMEIDHLCRVRDCINPAHLEVVTTRENALRRTRLITHCPHGHEYTQENTMRKPSEPNRRRCRTCWLAGNRRWKKARRANPVEANR